MNILNLGTKLVYHLNQLLYFINSKIFLNNIQKRLGYPDNTRLLIIHADDMGLSASENTASIESMISGMVNSGSIMIPCPFFKEIAKYARMHPEVDLGIHLTLTSEWSLYKWTPVLNASNVPSLVDDRGFMFSTKNELVKNAVPSDVEKEFRAQIELAIESGIDPTHLDSHMYAALSTKEIVNIYKNLGREFKLPVLLTKKAGFHHLVSKDDIILDNLYCADPEDYKIGLSNYYMQILKELKPGLSCILIHPAFNDPEMQSITGVNVNYGSEWRQNDFDFFTSNECCQIISDNNIKLITWREIRDKIIY